ncbi:MAG TPA: DNA polymerase III subunit gamma/tau [Clostridia bacterium]|nr:DNA polymerase III subunit gamma/tau [Clostridia bacterium]
MAYNSLYRRFRPDTFEKVIGQDHIIKTLVNQIKNNAIGHAYLFTGTRGTGKTSVAKIFSRAVNCENNITGSPCGKCETCLELMLSTNFDIMEIDAASNNSVEQVREITEKINYLPTVGRYKVYIIDEVHMLSKSAYNALLKTLEEPPSHAIFILATTEVHQIPATILSRCLRFDFRLVPNKLLVEHLRGVYKEVGATVEEEALPLIASAATGSVRDALSIADMCLSYCNNQVTYQGVLDVLGASDPQKLLKLASSMLEKNTDATLKSIAELCDLGKNVRLLSTDLATIFRNILFIKNCSNAETILSLPQDMFEWQKELALMCSNNALLFALNTLNELEASFRTSSQHRIIFEAAAVRISTCSEGGGTNGNGEKFNQLEMRLARLEKGGIAMQQNADAQKKNIDIEPQKTAKQIWNFVLAKLNDEVDETGESKNKLLILAATEGEPSISEDDLQVMFPSKVTVNLLSEKNNKGKLNSVLAEISDLHLVLDCHLRLSDENAEQYIRSMFGEDVVIK